MGPSKGEITIQAALDIMRTGGQKNRIDGVSHLKSIFLHNKKSSDIERLKDGAYHGIFEAIFQVAYEEKQAFLLSKGPQKTKAENNLALCSDSLRIIIRVATGKLKSKTVKAIIEHVTQLLPDATGEYCSGLGQFYLKVLGTVLEHETHVELLEREDWLSTVEFCLKGIRQYDNNPNSEFSTSSRTFNRASVTALSSTQNCTSRLPLRPSDYLDSTSSTTKKIPEELLQCLLYLVCTSNAPVLERAEAILQGIIRFLQNRGSVISLIHQAAFSALNFVLSAVGADMASLSLSVTPDIVQIISHLWLSKALAKDEMLNSAKDEMLITILLLRLHMERLCNDEVPGFRSKIEDLEAALRNEYSRRLDRDQLQLDDLDLSTLGNGIPSLSSVKFGIFRLRFHAPRSERKWAIVQAICILETLLHASHDHSVSSVDKDGEDDGLRYPRKRRRTLQWCETLIRRIQSQDDGERLVALQTLLVLLPDSKLFGQTLDSLLNQLVTCISDRHRHIDSWAMLCISICAQQKTIRNASSSFNWLQLWQTTTRLISSTLTCRAACYLLHSIIANELVQYQNIAEDIDVILTATDIGTPASLSESSLALMTHLLLTRNIEAPGGGSVAYHYSIRWLSTRWNPTDRTFAAYFGIDVYPIDILNFLRTCFGLSMLLLSSTCHTPKGIIGQSWLQHLQREGIIRYLLLLDDFSTETFTCQKCTNSCLLHKSERLSENSAHSHVTRRLILELFLPRFELLIQSWGSRNTEESIQVSADTLRCSISTCIFGCLLLPLTQDPRLEYLTSQVENAVERLAMFSFAQLREGGRMQSHLESILQALQPYLPSGASSDLSHFSRFNPYLLKIFNIATEQLALQFPHSNKVIPTEIYDAMELDEIFDDRQYRAKVENMKLFSARRDFPVYSSSKTFYQATLARLNLIVSVSKCVDGISRIPSNFISYIINLPNPEILACREPIRSILQSDLILDPVDASRLVQRVGKLLALTEYVSCEVALGLCLDILICTAPLWYLSGEEDLAESATQLYEWLISIVLPERRLSANVQKGLADLLLEIMRLKPAYEKKSLPSTRSCLFHILQNGPIYVKFHISDQLHSLFGLFVLKRHNEILTDVIKSLPSDPDWAEGIAFRLHVLGRMASRWPTLIRLCTYYILEVPGKIPDSTSHATRCLAEVSTSLGLKTPRDLFQLFASQLLYTWLTSETLYNIPYGIFGYKTLQELVEDSSDEISGLMVMRNQDDAVQDLACLLKITIEQLLEQSFTKVMAYSVAHDICVPPIENGTKYVTGEARIRKILGKEKFYSLVNTHFSDIIALFFILTEQEESIVEKSFMKDQKLLYAAEAMRAMSFSEVILPPSQQPAFKARYLANQIEHMCGRTVYDTANLYTPSMVVFLARRLLNTIHPSLGSLHACAVLRKLRVLIAISGQTALEGYPLEMLIHSVRPFMTDPECADDSISMIQYLIAKGASYLIKTPCFVAGTSVSILASLRSLLEGSPPSTMQQIQYQSTLTNVQNFHSWLGNFLRTYDTSNLTDESATSFRSIVQSVHDFRSEGNGEPGTPESRLLIEILEDELSGRRLVNKPSRDLALSLLYANFKQPLSFRNDIFGSDETATKFAATLISLCRNGPVRGPLLTWVGKVLGRAFAATGHIHKQLLQESGVRRIGEIMGAASLSGASQTCILRLLQILTLDNDCQTAGLAESVLRVVVTGLDRSLDGSSETLLHSGKISNHICQASIWAPFHAPPSDKLVFQTETPSDPYSADSILGIHWSRSLSISLVQSVPSDNLLFSLQKLLRDAEGFAEEAFPFIVHNVLLLQFDGEQVTRRQLSKALRSWLDNNDTFVIPYLKLLINTILYLRIQKLPGERSAADRINWLEIDYTQAAEAATRCRMFKTSLLFIEISISENTRPSRRSSTSKLTELSDLLLLIFQNIDDPDIFYGLQQKSCLSSVLARLDYEKDGLKSLAFQGAQYDSHLRRQDNSKSLDARSLVHALGMLNLDGLSYSLLQSQKAINLDSKMQMNMFQTARKLEQWDLPISSMPGNEAAIIYRTFQSINAAESRGPIIEALNEGLQGIMSGILCERAGVVTVHTSLQSLAVLAEMDEVLSASNSEEFEQILDRFLSRSNWMKTGKFDVVSQILSCRETLLSSLSKRSSLRDIVNISLADSRLVEVQTSLMSSNLNRTHGALQESLTSATYLTSLIEPCRALGVNIEVAANLEAANSLWDQGEMSSSIGILRTLEKGLNLKKQTIPIGRSDILVKLGYQVSVARLEKPDRIIDKYLFPALKELKGKSTGNDAGQVFHEFAMFCDQQLQDVDGQTDLERLRRLKEMKESEVRDLGKMVKAAPSEQRGKYHSAWTKAKQWLQLDNEEYQRLSSSREELLHQSVENYLLSLIASDNHSNDALRFSALWLEHSEEPMLNDAVAKHLSNVPTRKFASLMNQLTSRLLNNATRFQQMLFSLILNICTDHPYHGMYQIYAGCKGRNNTKDETAMSRYTATTKVGQQLSNSQKSAKTWLAISSTNKYYCQLAAEKNENRFKAGQKVFLKESPAGSALNQAIFKHLVPPPTLQVDISADLDYSRVPVMERLEPQFSIASGVSSPKVITAIASDGSRYKQLVKGGNDDLRQDAIMEQVFAQVSELLRANSSTRQRNLGIRTYKVLPLNSNAGIIEFVPNTIPLHEFLIPAHERYYPKDLKGSQCRKQINDAQTQKLEVRLKVYRNATDQFHPVLRYFFMEKFHDPDDWFANRVAYTRSTAAISMLGHVLGLGDRHGHNILLDEKCGEVVHIDLGVAFEMGRVLPVPELVPFRLTRDIVDGMGITKTEGIYRRCCEFTLEALRDESYNIITILDVLRYDPLYSWSISPVRLARLQEAQSAGPTLNPSGEANPSKAKEALNEPSEADRALTVVKKKLSKTLSVTATVNDLINQATDERNLAVLYSGWAAYA